MLSCFLCFYKVILASVPPYKVVNQGLFVGLLTYVSSLVHPDVQKLYFSSCAINEVENLVTIQPYSSVRLSLIHI